MIELFSEAFKKEWQLHIRELCEGIVVDLLVVLSYLFPEEKPKNSNSNLQYPLRHLQSQNINATSPSKMQRVTHI